MPSTIAQIEIYEEERAKLVLQLDKFCYSVKGSLIVMFNRWMEVDGFGHSGLLYKIIDLDKKIENLRMKLVNQSL